MVKLVATTVIAVALLATTTAAQRPAGYRRSAPSADPYLALREQFETQLGRELSPFEARGVAYLAERNWKEKLAQKAVEKARKHHGKVGDLTSGSQQQEDRRELVGSPFYAREYDFDTALPERSVGEAQSLYGRDFADFMHKFFHPYGDLKGSKKAEKQEDPKEESKTDEPKTDDAPAPDSARRSVYADSMDVMTRTYYGFGDMD